MQILFLTRKLTPAKGGMEKVAHELYGYLSETTDVKLVKWGASNRWIFLAFPYMFIASLWMLISKKIDIIYLQDGLLAPLGYVLKIFGKPVVITVHGLEITYNNRFYQFCIPKFTKGLDKVICTSIATKQECLNRKIPEEKLEIISGGTPDGLYMCLSNVEKYKLRGVISEKIGINLQNKKILLSVGRLIERKGVHWFIDEAMLEIINYEKDCIYLIVGEGIYKEKVQEAIERNGLTNNVFIMGQVDNEILKCLYNIADVFVMPNIAVEGDMEGFGLVAIEASSCALPVVASNLEGIRDAIKEGENGLLINSSNGKEYAGTILRLLENDEERRRLGDKAREFTLGYFSSEKMAESYLIELQKVIESNSKNG